MITRRDLPTSRQLAAYDCIELAPGVTLTAGSPQQAATTAQVLLDTLYPTGAWRLISEVAVESDKGWDVIVSELAGGAPAARALVVKVLVGPRASFFVATVGEQDAELAAKREAVLAFARQAVPGWRGCATLEDLLWLPDGEALLLPRA
jgi:hypothetical protein